MHERLFHNQPVVKQARDVSNIIYYEMRKHDGNRSLLCVIDGEKDFEFDEEFTFAAQGRDNHFQLEDFSQFI